MVSQIYPTVLRLNQAEFLRQNYDKRYDINFKMVNFPFLDGDVPCSLPMMYTFRNLFVSQEYVLMLLTSTTKTKF